MPVKCQICNKEFKSITNTHLKQHSTNLDEYKIKFPNAEITSSNIKEEMSRNRSGENNPNYGNNWSSEQKDNLSKKLSGKDAWNKGIPMSEEQKKLLSKVKQEKEQTRLENNIPHFMEGRAVSSEIKEKISNSIKKYAQDNHEELSNRAHKAIETKKNKGIDIAFFRGKKHSKETKELISELGRNRIRSEEETTRKSERMIRLNLERKLQCNKIIENILIKSNLKILNDINDKLFDVQCLKCNYQFIRTRFYFLNTKCSHEQTCDRCYSKYKNSKPQTELNSYINSLGVETIQNDRSILFPKELDIVSIDKKIAIEMCGLHWHSELSGKDRYYHLYKKQKCNELNIPLITVFEDEWNYKSNIIKSKISYLFNKIDRKIFARNCIVREIDYKESSIFLEKNHLQGNDKSSSNRFGIFYLDELVGVLTFTKSNPSKGKRKLKINEYELSRFCLKNHIIIPGAASKLFKFAIDKLTPEKIYTWADLRWGDGKIYESLGFKLIGSSKPNYWYIQGDTRIHRFNLRLTEEEKKANKTEWEFRKDQGWDRIWDCGSNVFCWSR